MSAGSIFVFTGRKRAMMINYPYKDQLKEIFDER